MPQNHINALSQAIGAAVDGLNDVLPNVETQVFGEIEKLLSELTLVDGNITADVKNLKTVARLRGKIESAIVENNLYKTNVAKYLDGFNDINALQQKHFDEVFGKYDPTAVLTEMQNQTVRATTASLTRGGISPNVVEPIQEILRQNVTTGTSYFNLVKQLRQYIVGNAENVGHLGKYVKQITTDSLNQYSAQYMDIVSNDLNLEWFRYTSAIVATSRDLCIALVRKKWYHKKELPKIVKGQFKEFRAVGGTIYNKTKLPHGMVAGTNPANFPVYRGGYNCPHQPIPVPEGSVPRKTRVEVYGRLDIAHDDKGFKISGANPSPNPQPIPNDPVPTPPDATTQIMDMAPKSNLRGWSNEHKTTMAEVLSTIPPQGRPNFVGSGAEFAKMWGHKLTRKANQWYGVSLTHLDVNFKTLLEETNRMVAINVRQFKTPDLITKAKVATQKRYREKFGRDYFYNTTGRLSHYHETGHTFDQRFGMSNNWKQLTQRWYRDQPYDVLKSESEAWAEAWADYFGNGAKRIPDYIKKEIDERLNFSNSFVQTHGL